MSFIYSQALVAAYLADNSSATDAFALSSESLTHKPSWWHDKTMEPSRHSRFGMTYAPLTESLGAELLTWFAADSLARTYLLPETALDWTAKGQGYGQKWQGSLGKYSPDSHSLKTAQLSLLEDSTGCCVTLPRWGLMLDGGLYPQPMLEPRTAESESGYWPTPQTRFGTNDGDLAQLAKKCDSQEEFNQMAYRAAAKKKATYWPTPTVCGNYNRKGLSQTSGDGLATVVAMSLTTSCSESTDAQTAKAKMYPTATATAYKGWSPNHNRAQSDDRLDYTVERESFQPGQQTPPMRLNPDWVEWLMGWPIGQTELRPLVMDRFQEWQQQHSIFSRTDINYEPQRANKDAPPGTGERRPAGKAR
jgi:hypothetical protein